MRVLGPVVRKTVDILSAKRDFFPGSGDLQDETLEIEGILEHLLEKNLIFLFMIRNICSEI